MGHRGQSSVKGRISLTRIRLLAVIIRAMTPITNHSDEEDLLNQIELLATSLGFDAVGVSDIDLTEAQGHLLEWLDNGFHGSMAYMQHHGAKRWDPKQLIPGTVSVISVRMNYLTQNQDLAIEQLDAPDKAYISRYALGRDYHKLIRHRLAKLVKQIEALIGPFGYRVFTDSAPVLEKPLAAKAGLGWMGKHSNILHKEAGSWFFLGEIYVDFPLKPSEPVDNNCGDCTRCIDVCPTAAIVAPYVVDARRCISYLTIENHDAIPVELRSMMGNRIYGCDDCQLFCPWNRFAKLSVESDYQARHGLDDISLLELFTWTEQQFLTRFEGSAIRRIGFQNWLRNLAVALGNAPYGQSIIDALAAKKIIASDMVNEHIDWAICEQMNKKVV
ncbi:MAG: epoxyqueuosine reductase [Parvicella sp.]